MTDVFLECNREVCRLLGYDRAEMLGRSPVDFSPPHQPDGRCSAEAASAYIEAALSGEPLRFLWQHVHREGYPIDTEVSLRAIRFADTSLIHGVLRDVTTRVAADRASNKALAKLRELEGIIDHSPAIAFIWRAETDWPVEFVSNNVIQLGYSATDFTSGRVRFADVVHADDLERVVEEVQCYSAEGCETFAQEYRVRTCSGEVKWVADQTLVRRNSHGNITHYQGILVDITERRRTEQALQQSEQRLSDILHTLPIGIAVIDGATHKIVDVNPAAAAMIEAPQHNIVGKVCHQFMCPAEVGKCPITDLGETVDRSERVLLTAKGASIPILKTVLPITLNGRDCLLDTFVDISAQKETEQRLRDTEEELRHRMTALAERSKELQCLHRVRDAAHGDASPEAVCRATLVHLAEGMRHPEIAAPVITLGDERFAGPTWDDSLSNGLHAEVALAGQVFGKLSVFYTESQPFVLPEEQNLVNAVAAILAHYLGRHQAEEALRESEQRFSDVLQASPDALLIIDGNQFVECNEATVRMLGYACRDELLMTHPSELSPPMQPDERSSLEKADEMIRLALTRGFHRFEWVHRRANGKDFPVEVSLTPISYRRKTVLHCLWRDLTEEKETELALRDVRNRLKESLGFTRTLLQALPRRCSSRTGTDGTLNAIGRLHKCMA